jgi:hypothetical protein
MPYQNALGNIQRSSSLGHVSLADNPAIKEKLNSYRIFSHGQTPLDANLLIPADQLPIPQNIPDWVMAFDGSPQEVPVYNNYPSTRIGYLQIAGVLVHITQMLSQAKTTFVDPAVIRDSSTESLHTIVMPSSNVSREDMLTVYDSWRAEVYEIFRDYNVEETPLLDTLFMLIGRTNRGHQKDTVILPKCIATRDCSNRNIIVSKDGSECSVCGGRLYPTDSLRIYEEVSEFNSNQAALNRLMSVLEHVTMIAYIEYLRQRQSHLLGNVAFILDGPLALFGPQAGFHQPILDYLQDLMRKLQSQSLGLPVIIGIEKTGQFAEHADAISKMIKPQTLMRLTDDYIYQRILATRERPDTRYGRDEYYGRKFFYKTAQEKLLTISIPSTIDPSDIRADDPQYYPTLSSALCLLDKVGTSLYKDAIIPIALAHSFASIPLRTGSRVLTLLSRQALSMD